MESKKLFSIFLVLALLFSANAATAEETIPKTAAFMAAETMFEARDLSLETYSLARDNLAYFLIQGAKLKKLQTLLAKSPNASTEEIIALVQTKRWKAKVQRTLETPGSNADIQKRLAEISKAFHEFTKIVHEKAAGAEYRYILSGSLVKGHFSSKSDIDLIIDTKSKELSKWAMNSKWSTTVEHNADYDEQVAIADAGDYSTMSAKLNLRLLGKTVAIEGQEYIEQYLLGFYVSAMDARGVKLDNTDFSAQYRPKNYLAKMEREMSIWMVSAIEQAKNLREAMASLFGKGGDKESTTYIEPMEPMDVETFIRSLNAENLHSK